MIDSKSKVNKPNTTTRIGNAVEGAHESYVFLEWVHPPTAASLLVGVIGGGYLGWTLFEGRGAIAIVLALIGGAVTGAIVAVIAYWAYRFFAAIGG